MAGWAKIDARRSAMTVSRRTFLTGAAAGAAPLVVPDLAGAKPGGKTKPPLRPERVLKLFSGLPGNVGLKIYAPPANRDRGFLVESKASQRMFVGSAIKTFGLCEALRQVDSPDILLKIGENPAHPDRVQYLPLNASVWNVDSQSFNPPHLTGKVTERTALEAMICHSDNTATDMIFKHVGPNNIRKFIRSAGLRHTDVPDSTRSFFGYLLGAKDYKHYTWKQLTHSSGVFVKPPLNNVTTLASSAHDLVSYYSRAVHGKFFKHAATLQLFREILAMGDVIWLLPVPLGVTAFAKGGSIDTPGFHAVCAPGAMLFDNRWVYFALIINWFSPKESDPATVARFLKAGSQALTLVKSALSR
jgi:beta-lactamase class A